jgi:hypothetical protein
MPSADANPAAVAEPVIASTSSGTTMPDALPPRVAATCPVHSSMYSRCRHSGGKARGVMPGAEPS